MRPALRTATLLAAALSALLTLGGVATAASAAGPAARGVDITPPVVDSCHALTYDEAMTEADPDPAVACSDAHTSVTTKVITLDASPDWSSEALMKQVSVQCERSTIDYFHNATKALQLSTYSGYFFYPTKAQREAGATWARCDVALYGKNNLKPLPTDGRPALDPLPLADGIAKCRMGKAADYSVVSCDHAHRYHATTAVKHPGSTYPGLKRLMKWTDAHCASELGRSFGYYWAPSAFLWRAGLRYSLCYKTSTS